MSNQYSIDQERRRRAKLMGEGNIYGTVTATSARYAEVAVNLSAGFALNEVSADLQKAY